MSIASKSRKSEFRSQLQTGLSEFWQKIYNGYIEQLSAEWSQQAEPDHAANSAENLQLGISLLCQSLQGIEQRLNSLRSRYRIFSTEISQESVKDNRDELIIEFCRYLGASNLSGDRKALSRWLDEDAISERWQSRIKDQEFYASFIMGRIAALFDLLAFSGADIDLQAYWQKLNIENLLTPWIRYTFEPKVQLAAFKNLSSLMVSVHAQDSHIISSELLRYTYRFSLDNKQQPELQIEALNLLAVADLNKAITLIQTRLNRKEERDQIFFREAIADIISLHYLNKPEIFELNQQLMLDPSPTVRQSVIRTLPLCDDDKLVMLMVARLLQDESDAVYCYLVTQLPFIQHFRISLALLTRELLKDHNELRLQAILQAIVSWHNQYSAKKDDKQAVAIKCMDELSQLAQRHSSPRIQYLAIEAREKVWANLQTDLSKLLRPLLAGSSNKRIPLNDAQQAALASEQGKRWLAAHIGHGFSIQIKKRHLQIGEAMRFRFWRFWHELFHPATDKRQHHSHLKGRHYDSREIIPSARLAEVSQTTVPGEPLHMEKEGHWRPFLPLVDQLISASQNAGRGNSTLLYHAAGKTEIKPPSGLFKNLKARMLLSLRFRHYARLRNIDYDSDSPGVYVRALEKLGFSIKCNGHLMEGTDAPLPPTPAVARFFDLALPLTVVQFYQDFQRYFVSVYQNTIQHILVFSLLMMALFWGSHSWLSQRVKQARKQIPMTIGGWGTRGKSGTERLKAALVNSVGLATVSKTTGCEAMFLYATRYGKLKEMFLFRPYDKATIWEQTFVTRLAAKLKSDVMCWECMGLTPRYIDILQGQWMKDDMITLTNCFPDHEDLQGPAGIDVPQVIAKFIGPKSRVWTTEENMLAYLEREAHSKEAHLTSVDWLDIATIPEDLLARFPYEEHPANIALVAEMAKEMQLTRTMAIKEMADRVVPDIGVLQVFPFANVLGRNIRFINGMSANERYGALANWKRLKYDNLDRQLNAEFNLVTVINNRADRVPRSKVFARLIAREFPAHRHFVIGNNLDGFNMFASEAWQERLDEELNTELSGEEFRDHFRELMRFLLIPQTETQLRQYIDKLWQGSVSLPQELNELPLVIQKALPEQLDDYSKSYLARLLTQYQECQQILENDKVQVDEAMIEAAHEFFVAAFQHKLCLVDDYYISGDQLNQTIAASVPAGIDTDILGLQNIKGPGLDFVYSWQQWQRVFDLLHKLNDDFGEEFDQAIADLAAIPAFTCLDQNGVENSIQAINQESRSQQEEIRFAIEKINDNLLRQSAKQTQTSSTKQFWKPLFNVIEEVVDVFDAISRGRKAKQILKDLATQRISLNKAAWLLMNINKRQKGGWLSSDK